MEVCGPPTAATAHPQHIQEPRQRPTALTRSTGELYVLTESKGRTEKHSMKGPLGDPVTSFHGYFSRQG